jgi:hypothetical protein
MCASHVIGAIDPADETEDDSLFDIANLFPTMTGPPMTVWVSPRGGARHDVRVKVNMAHGNQMSASNTAVVGVRPAPWLIEGRLDRQDQHAVFAWVSRIRTLWSPIGTARSTPFSWARRSSGWASRRPAVQTKRR